jgi:hypothetical protein
MLLDRSDGGGVLAARLFPVTRISTLNFASSQQSTTRMEIPVNRWAWPWYRFSMQRLLSRFPATRASAHWSGVLKAP